jgi:ABC-type amino acid transport substrate-binding protein
MEDLTLKHAALRRNPGGNLSVALLQLAAGEIDAYAANRTRLLEVAANRPGLRVLPDNFLDVQQAIVVPKGDTERLAIVNRLIGDALATGFIQAAIDRTKLFGVAVAPARQFENDSLQGGQNEDYQERQFIGQNEYKQSIPHLSYSRL